MLKAYGMTTVAVPGTPVCVTTGQASPTSVHQHLCHGVRIQAWPANTDLIYVGSSAAMVRATGVGVYGVIGIPGATGEIPYLDFGHSPQSNPIDLTQIWIDANVGGEGVIVTPLDV